jgi:hypothetical protein
LGDILENGSNWAKDLDTKYGGSYSAFVRGEKGTNQDTKTIAENSSKQLGALNNIEKALFIMGQSPIAVATYLARQGYNKVLGEEE